MMGQCKGGHVDDAFERHSGGSFHEEYSVVETTTVTHNDGGYPGQAPPGYY